MDAERAPVAPLDGIDVHAPADGTRPEIELLQKESGEKRQQLIAGLTWNVVYQAIEVVLSFASMLLLVRIIEPRDYGRAAVVVGILGTLGTFNAHLFLEQALQLPEGETPDWSMHWTFSFYLQTAMTLACQIVAVLCWMTPAYVGVWKLVLLASVGLFFQSANTLGATILRRQLDFRRLKIVAACGMCARLFATVALGLAGGGAYAIVFGSNVVAAMPFAVDLFVVRGWRPDAGWWRSFDRRRYKDALHFGLQRTAGGLVSGVRDGIEAAVMPGTIGFVAIGLVNRAQALYGTTVGRLGIVLADTVYPFLPREKDNRGRYASQATLYLQVMSFIAIPGALFIGQHGPLFSRVLYGSKWAAADQLIWPASLVGLGLALLSVSSEILLASGQVRACLMLDTIGAACVVPGLVAAWITRLALPYAWTLAGVQGALAVVALLWASPLLRPGWWRVTLAPPLVAALVGLAATRLMPHPMSGVRPALELVLVAIVFSAGCAISLRLLFGAVVDRMLTLVPAGPRLRGLLLFPTTASAR
jgi:PST family polysaccharide transporter